MSLLTHFKSVKGNEEKIEKIMMRKKEKEDTYDKKYEKQNKEILHNAQKIVSAQNSAYFRDKDWVQIEDVLLNIVDVVELWSKQVLERQELVSTSNNVQVLELLLCIQINDVSNVTLQRRNHADLTWYDRAIGMFLYLHPKIYGHGTKLSRQNKVAEALGIATNTVRQWCSLTDVGSHKFIAV